MMKDLACNKTQEALAAYLEGENAALQNVEVQAHLAGCEDCQAVYAEVQHALTAGNTGESSPAFPQNGAARPMPDAQYWNELPGRVMARIEGRLHLERKGAALQQFVPQPKRFRDARFVKFLTESKLRPALALVAVVALVFVITRSMQESLPGPERLKALPDAPMTAAESGPVSAQEESDAQRSAPAEERSPAKKLFTATAKSVIEDSKPAQQPAEAPITTTEQAASQSEQITPPTPQITFADENRSQAGDQPQKSEDELSLAQGDVDKNEAPASAEPVLPMLTKEVAEDRQISKAGEASGLSMTTTSQPTKMRAMTAASQAAPSTSENSYSQALWRAQQAATPKAQQIIWQDFLSAASDSTYLKLAIAQLAQSMLAQVDSNSSVEQAKSTLRFLEQHEAVLRLQLGAEKLSSEMRRVRLLQEQRSKP